MADPKVLISELTTDPVPVLASLMFPVSRSGTTWKLTGTQLSTLLSTAFSLGTMSTQNANAVNVTGGTLAGVNVKSNSFVVDNTDTTKKLALAISGFTTGTTVTLTVPPSSGTIVLTSVLQALSNKNMTDTTMTFINSVDGSKGIRFSAASITTATVRTLTAPDASGTMVLETATQTLTNKTITGGTVNPTTLQQGGSQAYVRSNALGTVSQSSGVPTGAIIERGSNANGEYVRYADGTQICTATLSTSQTCETAAGSVWRSASDATWTFPIAFAAAPIVNGAASTVGRWVGISPPTTTAVDIRQYAAVTSAESQNAKVTAIGRWF